LYKISRGSAFKNEDRNYSKTSIVTIFFTETKLLVLDVLSRETEVRANYFLAMIAPELSQGKYKRQAES
jgi:hypothetical protein